MFKHHGGHRGTDCWPALQRRQPTKVATAAASSGDGICDALGVSFCCQFVGEAEALAQNPTPRPKTPNASRAVALVRESGPSEFMLTNDQAALQKIFEDAGPCRRVRFLPWPPAPTGICSTSAAVGCCRRLGLAPGLVAGVGDLKNVATRHLQN